MLLDNSISSNRVWFTKINVFIVLNMLVVIISITIGMILSTNARHYFMQNVFSVSPIYNDNRYYFSKEQINALKMEYPNYAISYESYDKGYIKSDYFFANSKLIYTDSTYFMINNQNFISGSGWSEISDNDNVIVISESIAWILYGNTNATGFHLELGNRTYTVSGVLRNGEVNKTNCTAWLPLKSGEQKNIISNLFIMPYEYNQLSSYIEIEEMLSLYKNISDYRIVDLNRFINSMSVRYKTLLYVVWLYILYILISVMISYRKRRQNLIQFILLICSAFFIIFLLLDIQNIDIWIPNFQNEKEALLHALTGIGSFPANEYLSNGIYAIKKMNLISNIAFVFGFIGFVNLLFFIGRKTFIQNKEL